MRLFARLLPLLLLISAIGASAAMAQGPTFESLKAQFISHWRAKRFDAALAVEPALEAAARAKFGPNHSTYAQVIYSFGSIETDLGRFAEAQRHMLLALAIKEKALGREHPDVSEHLERSRTDLRGNGPTSSRRGRVPPQPGHRRKDAASERSDRTELDQQLRPPARQTGSLRRGRRHPAQGLGRRRKQFRAQ